MARLHAKRLLRVLGALAVLAPATAAHERWVHHDLIRPFDRTLFETLCWTNVSTVVGILLAALWLSWQSRRPGSLWSSAAGRRLVLAVREWCPTLLRLSYGLTLVIFALRGQYLAPDLRAGSSVEGQFLIGTAATAGLLLILGYRTCEAAVLSLLIFGWALLRCPFDSFDLRGITPLDVVTYGEVVGIGLYLAIARSGHVGVDAWRESHARFPEDSRPVALAALRIALGATLLLLGMIKFLVPELFMGVVQNYPEIFHRPFEELFGTSEEEVVFGASAVEVCVGLFLILGVYTRVVVVVLGVVFTTTAVLFKEEVLGHLPLVGMVLVLLIEGGGSVRPLVDALRSLRGEPTRPFRWDRLTGDGALLRRSPAFMAGVAAVGLVCGATLYGAQPSLATTGPWEALLSPETGSGVYAGHKGHCTMTLEVVPKRFGLNEFFALRCTVRDAATGALLDDVHPEVEVTMPQHGHGMPTAPRTRRLGPGRYLTEGCKLHMFGTWIIQVKVMRGGELLDRISTIYEFEPGP